MKITKKNVEMIYAALLKHLNAKDFGLMIDGISKSLAFKNENDDWHQLCKKPWYSQTYDSALYMNRFMIKPIHFQFYTLAEFSGDFSVNYHEVKKHFMRLLFNALKQNDLYILPINANLIQKYIPKINSLEELLILSDIN